MSIEHNPLTSGFRWHDWITTQSSGQSFFSFHFLSLSLSTLFFYLIQNFSRCYTKSTMQLVYWNSSKENLKQQQYDYKSTTWIIQIMIVNPISEKSHIMVSKERKKRKFKVQFVVIECPNEILHLIPFPFLDRIDLGTFNHAILFSVE